MQNKYAIANIPQETLDKIQALEQEIKKNHNDNIVLIAYEKTED